MVQGIIRNFSILFLIVFQFSYFSEFGKKLQAIEYVAEPIAFEKIDCPEFPTLSDEELKKFDLAGMKDRI